LHSRISFSSLALAKSVMLATPPIAAAEPGGIMRRSESQPAIAAGSPSGAFSLRQRAMVRMKIPPENYLHKLLEIKIARHSKSDAKRRRMEWIRKPTIQFMKRKSDRFNSKYGTTSNEFRAHIERQFTRKMTWENHGKVWHLDHIMPLSKFDLSDRNQLLIACNWQNFQPLLARKNLSKSDKILVPQLSLILQTK